MKRLLFGLLLLSAVSHASTNKGFSLYKLAYFSEVGLTSSLKYESYNDMLIVFNENKNIGMKKYEALSINDKKQLSDRMYNSIHCLAESNSDEAIVMNHIILSPIPGNAVKSFQKHMDLITQKCKVVDEQLENSFKKLNITTEMNQYVIYKYLYLNLLSKEYNTVAEVMNTSPGKWELLKWTFNKLSLGDFCIEEELGDIEDIEERKIVIETCSNLREATLRTARNIGLDSSLLQRIAFDILNDEEETLGFEDIPQIKSYYFKRIPFSAEFGY